MEKPSFAISVTFPIDPVSPIVAKERIWFQVVIAFTTALYVFTVGQTTGWNSPSIPKLMGPDSPVPITSAEGSYLVIAPSVGILFTFPMAWLMNNIGRKYALLVGITPAIIGWILIGTANSLSMLILAKAMFGLTIASQMLLSMYVAEISTDRIRGSLTTIIPVMGRIGVLSAYSIAPFVSVHEMGWIGMVSPLVFVALFIWMPESPYYLVGKARSDEARAVLVKVRRHNYVDDELDKIVEAVRQSDANRGNISELMEPHHRRGLLIVILLATLTYISGNNATTDYSQTIFAQIETSLESHEISIIMASISVASVLLGNSLVDRVGRKPLLVTSACGMGICTFIVGLFFHLSVTWDIYLNDHVWIPILAIMGSTISYAIGFSIVPYALMSELFPKHLKSYFGALYMIVSGLCNLLVSKIFQLSTDNVGYDFAFWTFTVLTACSVPLIIFMIPETKGKPFEEIMAMLKKQTKKKGKPTDGDALN